MTIRTTMAKIDKLNPYAYRIETAQTQVRDVIKQAFLWRKDFDETTSELIRVINSAASDIGIETLKSDCAISLYLFARNQKRIWSSMGLTPEITRNLGAYSAKGFTGDKTLDQNLYNEYRKLQPQIMSTGVPLQSYYKHTWEKLVKPTLNALAEDRALDPNDYTGRNSLRNLAEMEVRYARNQESISALRVKGVKIVAASSHEDCSKRCAPYQGRLYSLDGSSGDIDGYHYVPLEVATDIWYTTKAGRSYKNGLLGFNCRHYIYEYKGELLPVITEKERKKEYAITLKQRSYERAVRDNEAKALMYKDISKKEYTRYKGMAKKIYKEYAEYSLSHNRAFYPSRTEI